MILIPGNGNEVHLRSCLIALSETLSFQDFFKIRPTLFTGLSVTSKTHHKINVKYFCKKKVLIVKEGTCYQNIIHIRITLENYLF